MDSIDAKLVQSRARRAYERGRARHALSRSLWTAPCLFAALAPRQHLGTTAAAVGLLFATALALSFYGRAPGRAVLPAFLAGLVPLLAPLAFCVLGHACGSASCMAFCFPACCMGGLVAGAIVAGRAGAESDPMDRRAFLASACLLVALTGAIGCTVSGAAGVLGMLAATVLASAPALRNVHG